MTSKITIKIYQEEDNIEIQYMYTDDRITFNFSHGVTTGINMKNLTEFMEALRENKFFNFQLETGGGDIGIQTNLGRTTFSMSRYCGDNHGDTTISIPNEYLIPEFENIIPELAKLIEEYPDSFFIF